jgi:hypothetical protein
MKFHRSGCGLVFILANASSVIRDFQRDESLVCDRASRQEPGRKVAGAAFGFSFFFFLISFF